MTMQASSYLLNPNIPFLSKLDHMGYLILQYGLMFYQNLNIIAFSQTDLVLHALKSKCQSQCTQLRQVMWPTNGCASH